MAKNSLIEATDRGLYCPAGEFHIDPWQPVRRAVITHAHGDHAHAGSEAYLTAEPGLALLRARLEPQPTIEALRYGETRRIGEATVSLHPAGHMLGSAQVRIESRGEVCVVSGDYKLHADPTCPPFEPLACHMFVTEATYALPIYRWMPADGILNAVHHWWRANQAAGATTILFTYALGKAQRLLAGLDESIGPILAHGSVLRYLEPYRAAGIRLVAVRHADHAAAKETRGRALVLAPPSAMGSPWIRKFGRVSTGFASGWMLIRGIRRRKNVDRGFALSDHADWDALHTAIRATGASRIGVTHGYTSVLTRRLVEDGFDAVTLPTHFEGERGELEPARDGEAVET